MFLATLYIAIIVFGVTMAFAREEEPIALQVTPWEVQGLSGNQEVGLNPENCTMSADYDNGFRLIFKAQGERLTALRILPTTKEMNNVLKIQGFVGLGIEKNSYALQARHEQGQIDASLLTVPSLADKLMDVTVMRIKLGVENHYFALQGFAESYHRMLVCMGVRPTKTLKVVNQESRVPNAPTLATETPREVADVPPSMPADPVDEVESAALDAMVPMIDYDEDVKAPEMPIEKDPAPVPEEEVEVVQAETEETVDGDDPQVQDEVQVGMPKWRAMKGEKLSTVLKKWAEMQGVQTHIALDRDPVLTKDIVSNGSFEVAVNSLLRETGMGSTAPTAIITNAHGRVTHIAGYQGGVLARNEMPVNETERWRALQGTDLRKVLMRWSAKNNVDFVWDAKETFLIPQSVKATVDYDTAVSLLLSQFEGQPVRPVGQLNIDPDTGRKSLIIKTLRNAG